MNSDSLSIEDRELPLEKNGDLPLDENGTTPLVEADDLPFVESQKLLPFEGREMPSMEGVELLDSTTESLPEVSPETFDQGSLNFICFYLKMFYF